MGGERDLPSTRSMMGEYAMRCGDAILELVMCWRGRNR